jgi:hypothetical protein
MLWSTDAAMVQTVTDGRPELEFQHGPAAAELGVGDPEGPVLGEEGEGVELADPLPCPGASGDVGVERAPDRSCTERSY